MNIQELGDKIAALSPGPDGDARAFADVAQADKFGIEAPGGDGPTQQQQKQPEPESAPAATGIQRGVHRFRSSKEDERYQVCA
jgi:hypothetical protein